MRTRSLLLGAALILAACGTPEAPLPTLAPTLEANAEATSLIREATDEAAALEVTAEASAEASDEAVVVEVTAEASAEASPEVQPSSTDAPPSPTPRPSATPAPSQTSVPTATPRIAETARPTQATLPSSTPNTSAATLPPYDPQSAFSAYAQVAARAQAEHPDKVLFFISGDQSAGWTLGFVDQANEDEQAIYQISASGDVQPLELLVPLDETLRPFLLSEATLDAPSLASFFGANNFSPSPGAALVYTLQSDGEQIIWQIQDTVSGQRLTIDARSGMIVP